MSAVYPAGVERIEGETLALTNTVASLGIPPWATQVMVYDPSVDFRLQVNPKAVGIWFYDASAAAGSRWTNLTGVLSDRGDVFGASAGSGTSMDAMTTSDYLYVVTSDVIGGLRVVMTGSVNADASVIDVRFRNTSDGWTALTETDDTIAPAGTTLGATGSITWTAPTTAKRAILRDIVAEADAPAIEGYIWRIQVGTALSADVEIEDIWTLNKGTDRGYFRLGQEYHISFDRRYDGAIEAILASGTDTLELTWTG